MLSGLLSIGQLLPITLIVVIVVCVFESCWRKCPPDKLMIVSGAGKMRSVSGKGTFVIPGFQRVDMLALGAVQVQLTTENDIPTQDAILIHACAVAIRIGQCPETREGDHHDCRSGGIRSEGQYWGRPAVPFERPAGKIRYGCRFS